MLSQKADLIRRQSLAAALDMRERGTRRTEGVAPQKVIMAAQRPDFLRLWAIVDSNHGPPPYQSGALTN
jgi:hypothetical protein